MAHRNLHRSAWVLALVAAIAAWSAPAQAQLYGLLGSYYTFSGPYLEDLSFSDPGYAHAFDRIDFQVAFGYNEEHYAQNNTNGWGFDWEPFGPDAGAFGVKWDGYITVPDGSPLYLATHSDDGSYVHIEGEEFIDNGGQHYPTFGWSDRALDPGTYRIQVYLFCNDLIPPEEKSGIDLWWSPEPEIIEPSEWVPGGYLQPVPEPTSLALLLTGLGAGAIAARRRKRAGV